MKERIMAVLAGIRPDIDFEKEKNLIDDGILESFDVIQIVTALMDEFDIEIDADDIEPENLNSYEAVCRMAAKKLQQQ